MSLHHSWQQQRQQRQSAVAQRQQKVSEQLATIQQNRQQWAAEMRDELSLFRLSLASQNRLRQAQFQEFHSDLQQFCLALQDEIQGFLHQAHDRRHRQADQLAQDLQCFHATLSSRVAALRLHAQADLGELRADTQTFLAMAGQQRRDRHQQTAAQLAEFMEALRSQVQSDLTALASDRHQRASALQQELSHSREQREAEVRALFQRFADFRQDLSGFQERLRASIWGDVPELAPVDQAPDDDRVYQYLLSHPGAHLTEIETTLAINRFQAVDALRSLIEKGRVTQRDRGYLTY